MVSQVFPLPKKTGVHCRAQPPTCQRVKVILTKEVWDRLQANWREKADCFQRDLNAAWNKFDQVMKTIALKHHKSIRHVHNELHVGQARYLSKCKNINAWNAFCWKKSQTGPQTARVQANDENGENGMSPLAIQVSTLISFL